MSEQKTRCPHCNTTFRVGKKQLDAASGMVRCGKCYNAFNGLECLLAEKPELSAPAAISPVNIGAPSEDDDFLIDDNFDLSRLEEVTADIHSPLETARATAADTIVSNKKREKVIDTGNGDAVENVVFTAGSPIPAPAEDLEDLTLDQRDMNQWRPETHNIIPDAGLIGRHPSERKQPLTWLWAAGALTAALLLCLQLIYFNSLAIDRDSALWPLSSRVCETLGCPLPGAVDLDRILSSNLVIRNHPYNPEALLVDAVIVNTAEFDQTFPPLTLAFENLQGETVARRTFSPGEYLNGELAGLTQMPAGKPVKLELEIIDPGKDAVSFHFFITK